MLTGIIFESEGIVSLDLQVNLSKHSKIMYGLKNAGQSSTNELLRTDFFIIDPGLYSKEELHNILVRLSHNPEAKIIALASQSENELSRSLQCNHLINKPFDYELLHNAIEN